MSRRILATCLLAVTVSLNLSGNADAGSWGSYGNYGYSFPTTRYVIEVEWWHFDWDHYYWQEVQSFNSYEDALDSLMFHEWALENGYLGSLYDHHPYYIPVDVRMREVPTRSQYQMLDW